MLKVRRLVQALACAGFLLTPASALANGWVYSESDNPNPGLNSVLALSYGHDGSLNPTHVREYRTGGTGNKFYNGAGPGPGLAIGTFSGDQQVTVTPDQSLLFAVNQGSNTVAVFNVHQHTGALTKVKGSPFSSDGIAPTSVGYSHGRIVVANPGQSSPFDLAHGAVPGTASFVSFSVSKTGRLTELSKLVAGPVGLTQASFAPNGIDVLSTGFYTFKNMYAAKLAPTGKLSNSPGSPFVFPPSVYEGVTLPFFVPPVLTTIPFGLTTNPSTKKPFVYVAAAADQKMVVYKYDKAGTMTYVGTAANPGGLAACWVITSSNGRYLYTSNTLSQDLSAFTISKN